MARETKEMSALEVGRLTAVGYHFVGGVSGLVFQVSKSGTKSWLLRVLVGGKRREIGLGGYPDVTLAGAREAARIARDKIKAGIDPVAERQVARSNLAAAVASAITFKQASQKYIEANEAGWKNAKHAAQWTSTPPARYIAFADLLQRWMPQRESQESTASFIHSRIHQSRLHDFSPWLGETELSRVFFPSLPDDWERPRPPAEWAMFDLAEVEVIEASDFPEVGKLPRSEPVVPIEPPSVANNQGRNKQRLQEDEILLALRNKGIDPLKIPKWKPGTPGIKAEVQSCFTIPGQLFQSTGTFDKAWARLRSGGDEARIKDA